VAGDAEPAEVFAGVCREVGGVLGVGSTNLVRINEAEDGEVVGAWSASGAPVVPAGTVVPLDGESALVQVWRTGGPGRVDDYNGMPGRLPERLIRVGIVSSVAGPVTVANRLWGAIIASSGTAHDFPEGAEAKLTAFAELVADALASTEAREQLAASRARLVEAGDAERRRLERNLHDGAQQRLVALALHLAAAQNMIESDPEEARRLLEDGREELAAALEELRELARGIHPAVLSDHGLNAALEGLAGRSPVCVELETCTGDRLPENVEAAAYYVVAEALTNVARHSLASVARVRVTADGDLLVVEVEDDGRGGAESRIGTGLRGLADRVEAFGGRLTLQSPEGQGTVVRGEIPLRR
jgi:signal transduction histidine kinase